jgi:hypothetical protein
MEGKSVFSTQASERAFWTSYPSHDRSATNTVSSLSGGSPPQGNHVPPAVGGACRHDRSHKLLDQLVPLLLHPLILHHLPFPAPRCHREPTSTVSRLPVARDRPRTCAVIFKRPKGSPSPTRESSPCHSRLDRGSQLAPPSRSVLTAHPSLAG